MATRPGVNPGFEMEIYPPNEQRIIRKFSDHFYVTRSMKVINVGNSNYRAFLMRPAETLSIVMNIDREIVVLFANYENFEARSLRAFDDVYSQFKGDSRIDSSLRFIVSGDKNIDAIIRNFLTQNPDYPIIVPYRYEEMAAASSQSIITKIRSNHLVRDLFGFQSPLKNEYFFFGRDRLVNDVIDFHKSGQNCGIFGLRKSGKTSTIYAIQRRIKTTGSIVVVLDCQDTSVHARRYGALLSYVVGEVGGAVGAKSEKFDFGDDPVVISDRFKEIMHRYTSQCKSNILLIFDEIENISPKTASSPHWNNGFDALYFWQILRSFFQVDKKYNISFCFVGTNPGLLEQPKIGESPNPIYLFAKKIFIPNLSEDDTFTMVCRLGYFMGIDFPRAVSDYLYKRFGGHPFFIRQICSKIHYNIGLNRPVTASIRSCKDAEVSSAGEIKGYIGEIINSLRDFYPNEFEMLRYLALDREIEFYEMVELYPEFVEHLLGYGLVAQRGGPL